MAQTFSMINHQIFSIDGKIRFLDIFHKKDTLTRTIKFILFITNLHCKGLERSIGNVGAKKKKVK